MAKYKPGDVLFLDSKFYSHPTNYSYNQIVIDRVDSEYYYYHLIIDPNTKKVVPAPNYSTQAKIDYIESIYFPNKTIGLI